MRIKIIVYMCIINICFGTTNECFQMKYNPNTIYPPNMYKEMNDKLVKYPMKVEVPYKSNIIVSKGASLKSSLENKNIQDWGLYISIETNAIGQLIDAIDKSFLMFIGSSRPNTWRGVNNIVKISGASYVAHYGGGKGIKLCFVYQNIRVDIVSKYKSVNVLTREESTEIANKVVGILFGEFSGTQKKGTNGNINMSFSKIADDKAMISWHTKSSSTNNWVRMDASDGVLTIVDVNKVELADITEKNVTVECFEIKPDGTLNAYSSITVE